MFALPCDGGELGAAHVLVVRPECVEVRPPGAGPLPSRVALVTYLGAATGWHVDTDLGLATATHPTPPAGDPLRRLQPSDAVSLHWPAEAGRLLLTPTEGDAP